jgi:hypothetical protein
MDIYRVAPAISYLSTDIEMSRLHRTRRRKTTRRSRRHQRGGVNNNSNWNNNGANNGNSNANWNAASNTSSIDASYSELTDNDLQQMIAEHQLDTISTLILSDNYLTNIDALPDHIVKLVVDSNNIASIGHLPNSLETFACSYNPLTHIEYFPPHLNDLTITNAALTELPPLPDSLQGLSLYDSGLPQNYELEIPAGLKFLGISTTMPIRVRNNAGPVRLNWFQIGDERIEMNSDIPPQYAGILTIFADEPEAMQIDYTINPADPANLAPNFNTSNIGATLPLLERNAGNAFLSELKVGNTVARLAGNSKSTHSGNYALIETDDPERANLAHQQRRYLRTRGNPLTRTPVSFDTANLRKIREPTQREQLMYNIVKKSEAMTKERAAAATKKTRRSARSRRRARM